MAGASLGSRLGLVTLGICLAGTGLVFSAILWKGYHQAKALRSWIELRALVVASGIDTEPAAGAGWGKRHRYRVRYRYEYNGREWLSDRVKLRRNGWSRDRTKAERLAAKYPLGSRVRCFVNPADPSEAILERDTLAPGYTLWFPALFVLGGAGMLWAAARRRDGAAG